MTSHKTEFNFRYLLITRKFMVWAVGLGALSVIVFMTAIFPQVSSIWTMQAKLSSEQKGIAQLQKKVVELQEITTSPTLTQIQRVNVVLPSKKPLLELLGSLNTAVNSSGVKITSLQLSPGKIASDAAALAALTTNKRTGTYDRLNVEMTAQGSLSSLNQFFQSIENIAPLTTVTGITLNKQQRPGEQETLGFQADIAITTYYFTQSVTAALEAPLPKLDAKDDQTITDIRQVITTNQVDQPLQIQGGGLQDLFGVGLLPGSF